jgi:alkylation response protein AidB-like acyl-CoA dehydrogenase
MDFDLSEEQVLLKETVSSFLENECPLARVRELFNDDVGYDPLLWKGLAEMGVAGIHLPEEYGGSALEILDLAVVAETVGSLAGPVPLITHSLGSLAIALAGSAEQKSRWLPGLASGDLLASVAFAEEGGCWQPDEWQLGRGATSTGSVTLDGSKETVSFAEQADLFVVGLAGGGLAVVDRNANGVDVQRVEGADRTRRIGRVSFDAVAAERLESGGPRVAERVRDVGLVLLAADAFGGAAKLVDMSVEYAKSREQFGVTIGHFQAHKHQLANMAIEIEPSRALYWYAAHALDHIPDEAPRCAAIAKSHIADRYMQIARDAVEAHGGIGFTWEGDVQIWFKRAMFDRALLGTPREHRDRASSLADW